MTCRFFANGTCKYGDDCRFLHTAEHPEATARHTTSSHKSRNLIWDKRDTDTPAILEVCELNLALLVCFSFLNVG
eukprot:m.363104 g.363104  ORF g.363104 m.363104 type:complete len:75 (+) comp20797_c0_seq12:1385-1609(+)